MTDLTISTMSPASTTMHRNNTSPAAAVSTPAPQTSTVIKAGEFSQMKGTIDNEAMYVVQFRDSESGEVRMQYPSKKAASAYQKTAETVELKSDTAASTSAPAPTPAPAQSSSAPAQHAGGEKVASIGSGSS